MLLSDGPCRVPGCQDFAPFPDSLFLASIPIQDAPLQQLSPHQRLMCVSVLPACVHVLVCVLVQVEVRGGSRSSRPGIVVHREPPCDC